MKRNKVVTLHQLFKHMDPKFTAECSPALLAFFTVGNNTSFMFECCFNLPLPSSSAPILDDPKKKKKKKRFSFLSPKASKQSLFFCLLHNLKFWQGYIFKDARTTEANLTLWNWQEEKSCSSWPETASTASILFHCYKQTQLSRNSALWTFPENIRPRTSRLSWGGQSSSGAGMAQVHRWNVRAVRLPAPRTTCLSPMACCHPSSLGRSPSCTKLLIADQCLRGARL